MLDRNTQPVELPTAKQRPRVLSLAGSRPINPSDAPDHLLKLRPYYLNRGSALSRMRPSHRSGARRATPSVCFDAYQSAEVLSWSDWLGAFNAWTSNVGLMMSLLVALATGPAAILKALGLEQLVPFFQLVGATAPLSISSMVFFFSWMISTATLAHRFAAFIVPFSLLTALFYGVAGPPPLSPSDRPCPAGYTAMTLSAQPGADSFSCLPDSSGHDAITPPSLPELARIYWLAYGPWRCLAAILSGFMVAFAVSTFPLPKSFDW